LPLYHVDLHLWLSGADIPFLLISTFFVFWIIAIICNFPFLLYLDQRALVEEKRSAEQRSAKQGRSSFLEADNKQEVKESIPRITTPITTRDALDTRQEMVLHLIVNDPLLGSLKADSTQSKEPKSTEGKLIRTLCETSS
jgi:hypothetical protein